MFITGILIEIQTDTKLLLELVLDIKHNRKILE